MHGEPSQRQMAVTAAVAAVGGAVVGALADPVIGSLAAAGLSALVEKVGEDRLRRLTQFMHTTETVSALSADDITEILLKEHLKRGLFEQAVAVAASSQSQAKVTLLSKVFARALDSTDDDPLIDRASLLIGLVAQLEELHIEVLAVMASETEPGGRTAWHHRAIADKRPNLAEIVSPLLRRLEGLGLIEDTVTGGTTTQETRHLSAWVFTAFGQDLVTFLRSALPSDESPAFRTS